MDIERLTVQTPVLVLVALAMFATWLVWWHYRETNPPLVRRLRLLLASLRAAALLGALLAFADPFVEWTRVHRVKPVVAVFLDLSRSMSVQDSSVMRGEVMAEWWRETKEKLAGVSKIHEYGFGVRLRRIDQRQLDSLAFEDQGTDFASVLRFAADSLTQNNIAALLVLSDGNHTVGPDPVRMAGNLDVPVYFVVFGDTVRRADIAIVDVAAPEVAYTGRPIPIRVGLRKRGQGRYVGTLKVAEEGRIAAQQTVHLRDESEWWGTLQAVPRKAGLRRFQVSVSEMTGEEVLSNNAASMFVRVLPSQKRILLVGGRPSADFGFLRRALVADSSVDLKAICALGRGKWTPSRPQDVLANRFDEVILVDFPNRAASPGKLFPKLKAALAGCEKVAIFAGEDFDPSTAAQLLGFGALEFVRKTVVEPVYCKPVSGMEFHPLLRFAETRAEIVRVWSSLPPVMASGWAIAATGRSRPILLGRGEDGEMGNVGFVAETDEKSVVLFAFSGFWRWGFSPLAFGRETEPFRDFVRNLTDWVYVAPAAKTLRVEPARQVFDGDEPIRFRAYVRDERYVPVNDARVTITVRGPKSSETLVLDPVGDGLYEGSFPSLPEGSYVFEASAVSGERLLGKVSGSFGVRAYTLELMETSANLALPREVAMLTGGLAAPAESARAVVDSLVSLLTSARWKGLTAKMRGAWNVKKAWPLVAVVLGALASEWTIRRRNGLL